MLEKFVGADIKSPCRKKTSTNLTTLSMQMRKEEAGKLREPKGSPSWLPPCIGCCRECVWVFFYGSFHVRVLLASIGSALLCFFGSLRPFSLLNIYLKRSPPAFFSKKTLSSVIIFFQKINKIQKIECLPIAPAIKCDQCPLRLGLAISNHALVDSIIPKYVAPVARDPVTPGLIPL
jgi:hypothetical protein